MFTWLTAIRFQDRAKEAAWGSTLTPPANSNGNLKKRVKVQLGNSENPSNAVSMLVEASGRVSIIEDNGQSGFFLDQSKSATTATFLALHVPHCSVSSFQATH